MVGMCADLHATRAHSEGAAWPGEWHRERERTEPLQGCQPVSDGNV